MHTVVQNILEREVTRKEFLALVTTGLLSIIGVASFLNRIGTLQEKTDRGYGSSPYGGSVATQKTTS